MSRKIIVVFALFCTVSLSGCMNKIMNMVADSFPTYEETVNSWPELDENHSRIVLFALDRKLYEIYVGPFAPFSDSGCLITLDGVVYEGNIGGTFVFVDVKKGEHTLVCTKSNSPKLILNTKGGDIIYIGEISPLKVVEIEDIEELLKELNHAFDEALPYDEQPITIKVNVRA